MNLPVKVLCGFLRPIEYALAIFTYEMQLFGGCLVLCWAVCWQDLLGLCFNFTLDIESTYQSIETLQGVWSNPGSALPLSEGTGSGLASWIAKSRFFNAEVKNVLLSGADLPSCRTHAQTPLPPTLAGLAQRSGEITALLSNSSVRSSALACSVQADFSSSKTSKPTHTPIFFLFLFLAVLFSNRQDRDEECLIYFFPSFCSCLAFFLLSEHSVFSQHHSLLEPFIFLKYQSPFSSSRVSTSTALSPQVQKPLRSFRSVTLWPRRARTTWYLPMGPPCWAASRILGPYSGFGLLWRLPGFLLGSRDSPFIQWLF